MQKLKLTEIVLHLGLWALYFWLFNDVGLVLVSHDDSLSGLQTPWMFGLSVLATFYLFYWRVWPRLDLGRPWSALLLGLSIVLALVVLEYLLHRVYLGLEVQIALLVTVYILLKHCLWVGISCVVFYTVAKLKAGERRKRLELAHSQMELAFLKHQIQPHFLFNVLNSLYSSAYGYGDTKTASGIATLSSMLRYVLYDTHAEKVLLDNEVKYLNDYLALQMLRFEDDVALEYQVETGTRDVYLAPMLLITLVENAFKHGILPNQKNTIDIEIGVTGKTIIVQVSNPVTKAQVRPERANRDASGGVGLSNLKRRLALIYPNSHKLDLKIDQQRFIARMELPCN